jgi:hypothetical protein
MSAAIKSSTAENLSVASPAPAEHATATAGPSLSPEFRVELRRRHEENSPIEVVSIRARTIASARHAARLAWPDRIILAVTRA